MTAIHGGLDLNLSAKLYEFRTRGSPNVGIFLLSIITDAFSVRPTLLDIIVMSGPNVSQTDAAAACLVLRTSIRNALVALPRNRIRHPPVCTNTAGRKYLP